MTLRSRRSNLRCTEYRTSSDKQARERAGTPPAACGSTQIGMSTRTDSISPMPQMNDADPEEAGAKFKLDRGPRKWMPRIEFQMAKIIISFVQVIALMSGVNIWPEYLAFLFVASGAEQFSGVLWYACRAAGEPKFNCGCSEEFSCQLYMSLLTPQESGCDHSHRAYYHGAAGPRGAFQSPNYLEVYGM